MKENFAEDIEKMTVFGVPVDRCNIFSSRHRLLGKRPKNKVVRKKNNTELYGVELGPMFDWLDENTNNQYYAERDQESKYTRDTMITFYFMDESDAMAFKLMFGEKDLTNV